MKYSVKLAAAALCLTMGMAYSHAQTTNALTLNLQTVNFSLTGVSSGGQGGSGTSFRVATKDLIKAMGVSSNSAAKLQVASAQLISDTGTNESFVWLVSSGTSKNAVFTDVSAFFVVLTNSDFIVKGKTANQIMSFGFGVDTNGVPLTNILGGALTSPSFLVQGYSTIQNSGSLNSQVNGPGTSGGSSAVFKGTITATPPSKTPVTVTVIR